MLYWIVALGKCTREIKCTHGMFHVFYFERDVWTGKTISQWIFWWNGLFSDRWITAIVIQLSQQRKFRKNFPYSYPFYRIYHYPILAVPRSGSSLCGELLGLGFVTDKETEDFHSELPRSIAVLLAVRDCPHSSMKEKNYSMVSSAWRIGCTSFRLPSGNLLQVHLQWGELTRFFLTLPFLPFYRW